MTNNEVTPQSVLELVGKHMSRELNQEEQTGLQALIEAYGAPEIYGRVLDLISSMENEPIGAVTIDVFIAELEADKVAFGIVEWIRRELEAEDGDFETFDDEEPDLD